jgi:hypothetical protein
MRTFQERINELRRELIQSIIEILKSNGLQELDFPGDFEDVVYVVWFDNDGNAYDSPVQKVSLYEDGISLYVYDEYDNICSTLYPYDLGCQNLDWLAELRENLLAVIHEKNIQNNQVAIELTVLDNGNLEIAIVDKEEFETIIAREFNDERAYLAELMDNSRYIGNDWHCACDIGLTEAPAIGQGAIYPEVENENDGLPEDYENLWYFPDYMIKSYLEILEKEGKVVFTAHKRNTGKA